MFGLDWTSIVSSIHGVIKHFTIYSWPFTNVLPASVCNFHRLFCAFFCKSSVKMTHIYIFHCYLQRGVLCTICPRIILQQQRPPLFPYKGLPVCQRSAHFSGWINLTVLCCFEFAIVFFFFTVYTHLSGLFKT